MRVEFDFNAERDKEVKQTLALEMHNRGLLPDEMLLKEMGFDNVSEILGKRAEQNKVIQLGSAIAGKPELENAVAILIQNFNKPQPSK